MPNGRLTLAQPRPVSLAVVGFQFFDLLFGGGLGRELGGEAEPVLKDEPDVVRLIVFDPEVEPHWFPPFLLPGAAKAHCGVRCRQVCDVSGGTTYMGIDRQRLQPGVIG